MSETPSKPLRKYLITGGVCLAISLAMFFAGAPLGWDSPAAASAIAMAACDALFFPGAFCFLLGLLFWIANEGALDGVAWLGSYLGKTLVPGKRSSIERYSDSLERRRGKDKKTFGHLCLVGLVFILASLVALVVFNRLS